VARSLDRTLETRNRLRDQHGVDFDRLQIPYGTTAQRPTSPVVADFRLNTEDRNLEYYTEESPEAWSSLPVKFWDGAIDETISIGVTESVGVVTFTLEASGGGDLTCRFHGRLHTLDCTPAASVALSVGTDQIFQSNYVYILESAGVLTLTVSTTSFPDSTTAYCPVATLEIQSAASLAIDGPMKVHAHTDHVNRDGNNGHLSHMNLRSRAENARWIDGVAPDDMSVTSPDAWLSVTSGSVFQLHPHSFPARDMSTGDPVYVVNDPTTANLRITTLDSISQDALGNSINNKYINLVLWGVVSEDDADCKLFLNLPNGTYTTEAGAEADASNTAVYAFPTSFVGTAFLIARYTVRAQDSGAWTQSLKTDLRGVAPSSSVGGSVGTTLFTGLVDTPPDLGIGSQFVKTNPGATALEFVTETVPTWLALNDTPGSFTALKIPSVNAGASALAFNGPRIAATGELHMGSTTYPTITDWRQIRNMAGGSAPGDAVELGQALVTFFPFSGGTITGATTISAGGLTLNDNVKHKLGTGSDAEIYYDGTDLRVNPSAVGTGKMLFDDNKKIAFGTGKDAEIYYDGTDLQVNPDAVGGGNLVVGSKVDATGGFADNGTDGIDTTINFTIEGSSHQVTVSGGLITEWDVA
jgi:hypothetical protein